MQAGIERWHCRALSAVLSVGITMTVTLSNLQLGWAVTFRESKNRSLAVDMCVLFQPTECCQHPLPPRYISRSMIEKQFHHKYLNRNLHLPSCCIFVHHTSSPLAPLSSNLSRTQNCSSSTQFHHKSLNRNPHHYSILLYFRPPHSSSLPVPWTPCPQIYPVLETVPHPPRIRRLLHHVTITCSSAKHMPPTPFI